MATRRHVLRFLAAVSALAVSAAAHAFDIGLPLDCTPGVDCWVLNYVDVDPGPGTRDGACGARSYDGHDGTDFAIRDLAAMAKGVAVRAAAPGTVKAVRDGMRDVAVSAIGRDAVKGQECGNGVVIEHGQGWETQYCHMRQGSIAVRRGDRVAEGQTLGLVGLSGMTEFPHVHLTVRRAGKALDPFTGRAQDGVCGSAGAAPLWRTEAKLRYEPVVLFNAGVSAGPPAIDALRSGAARVSALPPDAPALVLWFEAFGVKNGDAVSFRLVAPDGRTVFDTSRTLVVGSTEQRAYQMLYAGERRGASPWPAGSYRGSVTLTRNDSPPIESRIETSVEVR
ncbi:MAG: M23 family metallopeptidase [Alphaproteobacteria bacterium]